MVFHMSCSERRWVYLALLGAGTVAAVGAVSLTALWWYKKKRVAKKLSVKAEDFDVPVARVDKLCVYPIKSTHPLEVNSTECLIRGLKNDRCQ